MSTKSLINTNSRILITTIFLFGIIYDISFSALGYFTTGRISILILALIYGSQALTIFLKNFNRELKSIIIFALISIYTLSLTGFLGHNDWISFSRSFWFLVYSLFAPFLVILLCKFELKIFLQSYFLSTIIQSLFVYLSMISFEYRNWMMNNIMLSTNIDLSQSFRSFGLSGTGGAILSLQISLGFISGLILVKEYSNLKSFTSITLIYIGLFLIIISEIFVGRTGLLLCFAALAFSISTSFFKGIKKTTILGFITAVFVTFIFFQLLETTLKSFLLYDLDNILEWSLSVFRSNNDGTTEELIKQINHAPILNWNSFLFGTARISNPDGSNYSASDSGYVQYLYANGIIITILFYISLLILLLKLANYSHKIYKSEGYFLIFSCYILELKEPFIHKYTIGFFIISYLMLSNYKNINSNTIRANQNEK